MEQRWGACCRGVGNAGCVEKCGVCCGGEGGGCCGRMRCGGSRKILHQGPWLLRSATDHVHEHQITNMHPNLALKDLKITKAGLQNLC